RQRRRRGDRGVAQPARRPRAGGGDGPPRPRARARRAHVPPPRAPAAVAARHEGAGVRKVAIVPAYNEQEAIGGVVDELKAFDPELDVLVVDDASHDLTAQTARRHGALVVTLPFNLGIGGAVQTGFRYAAEQGYELAARVDGDGQHDPVELAPLMDAVVAGQADICVGSRFAGSDGYRSSRTRRIGIRILAGTVSLLTKQHV